MSHFTVLVTGDNIEETLAPFIEQLEDEEDRKYFSLSIESTKEEMEKEFAEYIAENEGDYSSVEEYAQEYHGYEQDENGNWGYLRNPNAKWDWYSLGGRWTGMLKLKNGASGETGRPGLMTPPSAEGYADSALIKDIDFDGMREEAAKEGREYITKFFKALVGKKMHQSWDSVRESFDDINIARDIYNKQESIVAVNEVDRLWSLENLLEVCKSHRETTLTHYTEELVNAMIEEYVEFRRISALSTYAFLHEGKWSERGKMGWFGMSSDEMERMQWEEIFAKFIESLPEDTRISIVDCHI